MKLKRKTRNILSIILVTLLTFGLGFGVYSIASTKTKTISPTVFSVGGVSDNDGKHVDTKKTLYNEEFIECQGLRIERDFESTVRYSIFYYDVGEKYLGSVDCEEDSYAISGDYANARYCRIVIDPNKTSDISVFEKYSIANQLKITVNKNQNYADTFNQFNPLQNNGGFTVSDSTLNFDKNDTVYDSYYVKVAQASKYYPNRLVILSSYELEEKVTNAVYRTKFINNNAQNAQGTKVDLVDSYTTKDGYFAYVYSLTYVSTETLDYYVVFNHLDNQVVPQVYLYTSAK